MKIGIGITTHNRTEIFNKTIEQHIRFLPHNAQLVVVDDASTVKCKKATFRFDQNVGIAKAKNKCLELLDDCDHIFLFDDDCFPIVNDWWKPYVESKEPHLMYIFKDFATGRMLNDTKILYEDEHIIGYSHPRGCMLYFERKVLDIVGGYDVRFKRWGYEHGDISTRIFNNHLTTFKFADVPNSNKLIRSEDEHETAQGTVIGKERKELLKANKELFEKNAQSKRYCQYKPTNNVILTSYFTRFVDTQRNKKWKPNFEDIAPLIKSCAMHKQKIVVLNDCFDRQDNPPIVEYERIETKFNPYFQRWFSQYQYLRDHPEIDNVFCVDATDVEMFNNPFNDFNHLLLYVGDENQIVDSKWMRKHFPRLTELFQQYGQKQLLNCGVIGGSRRTVMNLCHDIMGAYFDDAKRVGKFEMGIFNLICYQKYSDRIIHGRQVTTLFKKNETQSDAWFRHK